MNNLNKNNDLIPFNLKYSTLTSFKAIMLNYSYFYTNILINPYLLNIYDSNKNYIGYLEFKLVYNTPSAEDDPEYVLGVHLIRHYLIKACTETRKQNFHVSDPNQYYLHIIDKKR
jgi:hypothetical protein